MGSPGIFVHVDTSVITDRHCRKRKEEPRSPANFLIAIVSWPIYHLSLAAKFYCPCTMIWEGYPLKYDNVHVMK